MADSVKQKLTTLRILWGAMLGSIGMYLVVLLLVRKQQSSGAAPTVMIVVLAVISLGLTTASVVLPRHLFRKVVAKQDLPIKEEPLPGAFGQYREGSATQRVFAKPKKAFDRALTLYNTPFVLGCALGEAVAVFGFVLGFLGAPLEIAAVFFAVGAIAIGEKYPSIASITKQLEAAKDAKMPD